MPPQTSSTTSAKLTPGQSNRGEIKTVEVTTPELGPVGFWSPKSSSFSGSDSIEEAARNFRSPLSINKLGTSNFFIQHDKVKASKLRRYLETCGCALEQFLQRQTSSKKLHYLHMPHDRLVRGRTSLHERTQYNPVLPKQYSGNESSCNLQHFGI